MRADSDGRFRIAGLPAGRVKLGFMKDGYSRHEEHFSELDRENLLVRLAKSGALAGRVIDGLTGQPIPSFRISFVEPMMEDGDEQLYGYGAGWSVRGPGMPFTGTDGYWTTADSEDFDLGTVIGIQASAAGYTPSIHARAVVVEAPDSDSLVIALFSTSARIEGRVVSADDRAPIPGATIWTSRTRKPREGEDDGPSALTDEFGVFELEGLPFGRTSLMIDHPDWVPRTDGPFDVVPSERVSRVIELARGGTLEGRLLDWAGIPLAGEGIHLGVALNGNARRHPGDATTDEDGRFSFEGLKEGGYQVIWVRTLDRDQASYYLSYQVTVEGEGITTVELRPKGEATLVGELRFESGTPEFAHVTLWPWPPAGGEPEVGLSRIHQTVAIDGHFVFDRIQPGNYFVRSLVPGAVGGTEIEVPEEGEVRVWVDIR